MLGSIAGRLEPAHPNNLAKNAIQVEYDGLCGGEATRQGAGWESLALVRADPSPAEIQKVWLA